MVHTGSSQNTDSTKAGLEAALAAQAGLAPGSAPSWALAFCGGRHDPACVLAAIHGALGDIPVFGGAAAGVMTNSGLGCTGFECGIALFDSRCPVRGVLPADLQVGEFEAGRRIGASLRQSAQRGDSVLILFDNLRSAPPPVLYAGSKLMDGVYEGLEKLDLNIFGGGLIGDFTLSPSFLFDGDAVTNRRAMAILLPRELTPRTTIMHGCIPISSFLEITRIEGPVLYELNGRRATDVFVEMLHIDNRALMAEDIPFLVTLGQKHGDPFAPFSEEQYVNRLIIGSDPVTGSVTLFEADFRIGARVQIMAVDNRVMVESAGTQTEALLTSMDRTLAEFALYIDCAGRASAFNGSSVEEAGVVRRLIGDSIPFLGFYSGVEIARFLGRSRPLDWTGVLTVFTRG